MRGTVRVNYSESPLYPGVLVAVGVGAVFASRRLTVTCHRRSRAVPYHLTLSAVLSSDIYDPFAASFCALEGMVMDAMKPGTGNGDGTLRGKVIVMHSPSPSSHLVA